MLIRGYYPNEHKTFVTPAGFEPATTGAEIQYSIQLNYGA